MPVRDDMRGLPLMVMMMTAACGGSSPGDPDAAQAAAAAQQTTTAPSPPTHRIEAPIDMTMTREYYEGAEEHGDAARGEIPRQVRTLLTIIKDPSGSPRSYEWKESRIELDVVHRLIGSTTSSGSLTTAPSDRGAVVYTLAAAAPSAQVHVLTRLHDRLYVPRSPADPSFIVGSEPSLQYAGSATKGRVEISNGLSSYPNWLIRLRVGDVLGACPTNAARRV